MSEEKTRPSIEELERILASNEPLDIQINPDGSVTAVEKGTAVNSTPKVLSLKEVSATYY
jgi:hypothetical protein